MLYETLLKRRSIRRFKKKRVPDAVVVELLKAALLSPSSRNIRPWYFVVVDTPNILTALAESKPHGAAFLAGAPLAVAVVADKTKSDVWVEDTSIASAILLLMADELDLGACWCQIRKRPHDDESSAEDYVKTVLALPEHIVVESIIGLGYPAEQIPRYDEATLRTEKVSYNQFASPFDFSK